MLLPLFFTLSVCLCQLSHCRTLREAPEGSYISEKQRLHLRSSRERPGWLAKRELVDRELVSNRRRGARARSQRAPRVGRTVSAFSDFLGQGREIIFSHNVNRVLFGESLNPGSSNRPSLIKLFFLCKFALCQSREPFSITKSYKVGLGTWESFPLFRTWSFCLL